MELKAWLKIAFSPLALHHSLLVHWQDAHATNAKAAWGLCHLKRDIIRYDDVCEALTTMTARNRPGLI